MNRSRSPDMDIEDEMEEEKIELERDEVTDPIEIILPIQKTEKPKVQSKKTSKLRRLSKTKPSRNESAPISYSQKGPEVAQIVINELSISLDENLKYFGGLLLEKITKCMAKFQGSELPISMIMIEDSLQFSLKTLNIDEMLDKLATNFNAIGIRFTDEKNKSLKLILNHIKESIDNERDKPIQHVILLFDYYLQEDSGILLNLTKYLEEDLLLSTLRDCRVTIILPSLCTAEPNLDTEIEYAKVKLSSPSSLISKMLVDLLRNYKFFPIFSKAIVRHLLGLYEYYELSFQDFKSRLAIITQDFLCHCDKRILEVLIRIMNENELLEAYGEKRIKISKAVNIFYAIENFLFKTVEDSNEKCLNLFISKEEFYALPAQKMKECLTADDALKLAEKLGNIILETTMDQELQAYGKNLINLSKQSLDKIIQSKPASKVDKRLQAIMEQSEAYQKQHKEGASIKTIFTSINDNLRVLFAKGITSSFDDLQEEFPSIFYYGVESVRASASPDFLGQIVTFLNSGSKELAQRPGFSLFIESLQEYNVGIDIDQCLLSFKQQINKLKDSEVDRRAKENPDMLFYLYVMEMKYIGLITERGRGKMCFQKDYFAKTFHRICNITDMGDDDD